MMVLFVLFLTSIVMRCAFYDLPFLLVARIEGKGRVESDKYVRQSLSRQRQASQGWHTHLSED